MGTETGMLTGGGCDGVEEREAGETGEGDRVEM